MISRAHIVVPIVLFAMAAAPARAEVLDAAANGFSIRHSSLISAGRAEVYGTAVDKISQWWNSDHTISGDAANLYIDAQPHGCFCESLGSHGGLIHLAVTFVQPGVMLRFSGGLGPLGLMGVSGNMTWEFQEDAGGTRVILNYAVGGYLDGGLDAVAAAVDGVLIEQIENLRKLVETGKNQNSP